MPLRLRPCAAGFLRDLAERLPETVHVLRFPLAAVLAFLIASQLGLGYPSWAAVSAIIVLQEDLNGTRTAVHWRVLGTMTGVAVALLCGTVVTPLAAQPVLQIGISVAVCAVIARAKPALRVAMWTVPIVFMSRAADVTLVEAGLSRGSEVVIGCVIATVVQWLVEAALNTGRKGD